MQHSIVLARIIRDEATADVQPFRSKGKVPCFGDANQAMLVRSPVKRSSIVQAPPMNLVLVPSLLQGRTSVDKMS
jgi:hypothetical protein